MQISFLVRGDKARKGFENATIPNEVNRHIGVYCADGGDLFFITLDVEGRNLASARALAKARDAMPLSTDVHILRDDASLKFGTLLYPSIFEFERGIRTAYTIAMCAAQGQFDDPLVSKLESNLRLGELRDQLLHDNSFLKDVRAKVQSVTKEELLSFIQDTEERSAWNKLFGEKAMPAAKAGFKEIVNLRNDVMHFHTITETRFDSGKSILRCANSEIQEYVAMALGDVNYPKLKAPDARVVLVQMNENYKDALAELGRRAAEALEMSGAFASASLGSEVLKSNSLSSLAEQFKNVQIANTGSYEALARSARTIGEIWGQVSPMDSRIKEPWEQLVRAATISEALGQNGELCNAERLKVSDGDQDNADTQRADFDQRDAGEDDGSSGAIKNDDADDRQE